MNFAFLPDDESVHWCEGLRLHKFIGYIAYIVGGVLCVEIEDGSTRTEVTFLEVDVVETVVGDVHEIVGFVAEVAVRAPLCRA